jgi:hypothetical protein
MAVGAGVSVASKWKAERTITRATAELEEKLPASIIKVTERVPADILRAGGAVIATSNLVVASGRSARMAVSATGSAVSAVRKASGIASNTRTRVRDTRRSTTDRVVGATNEWRDVTEQERRELKSRYIRATEGDGPALDVLLDRRDIGAQPLPETPDPIPAGRRRFRPSLPPAPVNRVQRSFQRPIKPWDRPVRGR